jgi:hypothetical protein
LANWGFYGLWIFMVDTFVVHGGYLSNEWIWLCLKIGDIPKWPLKSKETDDNPLRVIALFSD